MAKPELTRFSASPPLPQLAKIAKLPPGKRAAAYDKLLDHIINFPDTHARTDIAFLTERIMQGPIKPEEKHQIIKKILNNFDHSPWTFDPKKVELVKSIKQNIIDIRSHNTIIVSDELLSKLEKLIEELDSLFGPDKLEGIANFGFLSKLLSDPTDNKISACLSSAILSKIPQSAGETSFLVMFLTFIARAAKFDAINISDFTPTKIRQHCAVFSRESAAAEFHILSFSHRFSIEGNLKVGGNNLNIEARASIHSRVDLCTQTANYNPPHNDTLFTTIQDQKNFWNKVCSALKTTIEHTDNPDSAKTSAKNLQQTNGLAFNAIESVAESHYCGQFFATLPNDQTYMIVADRAKNSGAPEGLAIEQCGARPTGEQLQQFNSLPNIKYVHTNQEGSISQQLKTTPVAHVPMAAQKVGNCTIANSNALIYSALIMEKARQMMEADPAKKANFTAEDFAYAAKAVKPTYKQWKYHAKLESLKELCNIFKDDRYQDTFPGATKATLISAAITQIASKKIDYLKNPSTPEATEWAKFKANTINTLITYLKTDGNLSIPLKISLATQLIKTTNADQHLSRSQKTNIQNSLANLAGTIILSQAHILRRWRIRHPVHTLTSKLETIYKTWKGVGTTAISADQLKEAACDLSEFQQCQFAHTNLAAASKFGSPNQIKDAIKLFEDIVGRDYLEIYDKGISHKCLHTLTDARKKLSITPKKPTPKVAPKTPKNNARANWTQRRPTSSTTISARFMPGGRQS